MNWLTVLWSTAPLVHPDPGFRDQLARLKYCVRALRHPRLTLEWFRLLDQPRLRPVTRRHPRLFSKLQRPYLHRRLGPAARLEAMRQHYGFLLGRLGDDAMAGIYRPEGLLLGWLPETGSGCYALRLLYRDQFEKEGDLVLALREERSGGLLFTLTFAVGQPTPDTAELFIGGLQGSRQANERERIVELTRTWHGLRPKALLVFALQRLAQLWNCQAIQAVGDAEHIYRHAHRRRDIPARHDEFWAECGGLPGAGGNFRLPAAPTVRDISELPRGKRPVYRRRYAMLELLGTDIQMALAGRAVQRRLEPAVPITAEV